MSGHDRLEEIVASKRRRLADAMRERPIDALRAAVGERAPSTLFRDRLRGGPPAFICEIKRGSPSKGLFAPDLDPLAQADAYVDAGADAISVLTEEDHFFAPPGVLGAVRGRVSLPVLQKDFFVEEWQLYDMKVDRTETNDLSKEKPKLRAKMIEKWNAWATRCGVLPWRPTRPREMSRWFLR